MGYKMDALAYNKPGYALTYLFFTIFTIFIATESWIAWEVPLKVHRYAHSKQLPPSLRTVFIHCPAAPGQSQLSHWRLTWPSGHLRDTSSAGAWRCFSQPAWSLYRWVWWALPGVKIQNAQYRAVQKQTCRVFHFCRPNPSSYQNSHLKVKRKKKKTGLTKESV